MSSATVAPVSAEPPRSAAPSASAKEAAVATPKEADYVEIGTADGRMFTLNNAVLSCGPSCNTGVDAPSKVSIKIIDRKGVKDGPVSPEGWFREAMMSSTQIFSQARPMVFSGSYPDALWASMELPYDRSGYGDGPSLQWGPKGWGSGDGSRKEPERGCTVWNAAQLFQGRNDACDAVRTRARRVLPELVKRDVSALTVVALPSGDVQLYSAKSITRLVNGAWVDTPAPWGEGRMTSPRVLSDGRVLVNVGTRTFVIDQDLSARSVGLESKNGSINEPAVASPELIAGEWWLIVNHDTVAVPKKEGSFKPYSPDLPKEERADHDIPMPAKFSDACTTPFVTFAGKPDPGFDLSVDALMGHGELQEDIVFLEILREGVYYFSAQFKSIDHANLAMDLAKKVQLHPQMSCLDATSHIPDLTLPPKGVRVYWVNLAKRQVISP